MENGTSTVLIFVVGIERVNGLRQAKSGGSWDNFLSMDLVLENGQRNPRIWMASWSDVSPVLVAIAVRGFEDYLVYSRQG